MQAIQVFAVATALSTLVALAICVLFRKSLIALAVELCEGDVRGRFWALFAQTCVVLTTFFSAIVFAPRKEPETGATLELFGIFVAALRGGVFGLLGALSVLGLVLAFGILAFNARRRRQSRSDLAG